MNLLEEIGWMIGEILKGIKVSGFELRECNKVIL
jgi:hypothetical protein